MTTIRVATRKRFTQVDRQTVNDIRLSFKARGILVWLLDKPDDWETSAERIESQGIEGRKAIRSALKELEALGYLVRTRYRDQNNRWRTEWRVYENPRSDPPTPLGRRKGADGKGHNLLSTETDTETTQQEQEQVSTFSGPPPELMQAMKTMLKRVK